MLKMSLTRNDAVSLQRISQVPETGFDDPNGLIASLCEELEASESLQFEVSGFGQDWFVTVLTDLPVLLEQLPAVREQLLSGNSFEIDFYEQGVERKLCFERREHDFLITCMSGTSWVPDPLQEQISKTELIDTLQKIREIFLASLCVENFQGSAKRWIEEWAEAADFSAD